jgi:hypothetical protein
MNWALLSALLALAVGLLMEEAAIAADNRQQQRPALLLIIYGVAIVWLHMQPVMPTWWARIGRMARFWRSSLKHKK